MENKYLVLYDISDNKRINKAASVLLDYGIRIQKSIFEIYVHEEQLKLLKARLLDIIDPDQDGIKIFPVCEACVARRRAVGLARHLESAAPWTII